MVLRLRASHVQPAAGSVTAGSGRAAAACACVPVFHSASALALACQPPNAYSNPARLGWRAR